ncbi:MAG: hypothetical protein NTV68_03015, partial [Methanomicrobiales archaeon]|nr:hypothetical protein [Methanomicrobiales archaeon]
MTAHPSRCHAPQQYPREFLTSIPNAAFSLLLNSDHYNYMADTVPRGPFAILLVSVFLGLLGL